MNLFLSPSFLKWMNACVIGFAEHSILALAMSIPPTSFIDSFKSCVTSDSDVSLWNHCFALILIHMFSYGLFTSIFVFSSMSRIFVILSMNCLYLSSSSFIFYDG